MGSILLPSLILLPILGAGIILCLPSSWVNSIKSTALWTSSLTFLVSLWIWLVFDPSTPKFQLVWEAPWLSVSNIYVILGIDGISLFLVILTTFLIPICLLTGWASVEDKVKEYCMAFLMLESFVLAVFCLLDLFLFYIFFEAVLIPMFFIIGIFGSRERKIRAAYQFFLYTLIGSLFMLLAILSMYLEVGSTQIDLLYNHHFSEQTQLILWLAFFASFAVKVPMVPVHIWLPEAHVEAPTAGSVILAGILLKLGTYGFLRFSIPLFPEASAYFAPLVMGMSLVAITYTSLTTIRQIDLKKIIAYSSVAHMGVVTLGLFTLNTLGLQGSLILMLSHGFVSPGLFLCVGVLYDRYKTRLVKYYGGSVRSMPLFSFVFVVFTLANIGMPGTSSFIGEFFVFEAAFQSNPFASFIAATGMLLGAIYSLWLLNRVVFGHFKPHFIATYADINRREFFMFLPLLVMVAWMGFYPDVFMREIGISIDALLQKTWV
uniref:NADH-ubiquinone oxidoreductase chain 4 n=1 Tax=Chloropicon sp. RCC4434 TaxID=2565277 RepID=A0A4D6C7L3_9CHLO|nr:NADH dehydrogenase subunit 4 [Chloropicon sp. RCC4434]